MEDLAKYAAMVALAAGLGVAATKPAAAWGSDPTYGYGYGAFCLRLPRGLCLHLSQGLCVCHDLPRRVRGPTLWVSPALWLTTCPTTGAFMATAIALMGSIGIDGNRALSLFAPHRSGLRPARRRWRDRIAP
jgi:hypothetical protein